MQQKNNCLPCEEIIRIVEMIDQEYFGLAPSRSDIEKMYASCDNAIISSYGTMTLWIDAEYIAYADDDGDIIYVYATDSHIKATRSYYKYVLAGIDPSFKMPDSIEYAFSLAEREMQKTGTLYWVDYAYRPGGDAS